MNTSIISFSPQVPHLDKMANVVVPQSELLLWSNRILDIFPPLADGIIAFRVTQCAALLHYCGWHCGALLGIWEREGGRGEVVCSRGRTPAVTAAPTAGLTAGVWSGLSGSPGWLDNSISCYLVCSGSAQCSGVRTRLSKVDRISAFQGENIQCSSALESYAAAAGMQSQCKVCLSRSFCTDWDQRQESLNLNKCIAALYFTPDCICMYKFFYFKRIILDSLLLYYPKHLITYYLVFTSSIKGSVILQNERHYLSLLFLYTVLGFL